MNILNKIESEVYIKDLQELVDSRFELLRIRKQEYNEKKVLKYDVIESFDKLNKNFVLLFINSEGDVYKKVNM